MKEISTKEKILLSIVQALCAINHLTNGVFLTDKKEYIANHFDGCFEIVSLNGTIIQCLMKFIVIYI